MIPRIFFFFSVKTKNFHISWYWIPIVIFSDRPVSVDDIRQLIYQSDSGSSHVLRASLRVSEAHPKNYAKVVNFFFLQPCCDTAKETHPYLHKIKPSQTCKAWASKPGQKRALCWWLIAKHLWLLAERLQRMSEASCTWEGLFFPCFWCWAMKS